MSQTLNFSWNDEKNESNISKHGVSFETAIKVFDDPFSISAQDRYIDGEERWQTVGIVGSVVVLLVAHTWKEDDETVNVRIISARKATPAERNRYEKQNF